MQHQQRTEEVFDWADYEPAPAAPVARYAPPAPLAQVPASARVIEVPGQVPYYAHQPAPLPPYDPLPARMYGCGVMAAGIGLGGTGVGFGCYLLFAGMSLATDAVIGAAAAMVAGAVIVVALRLGSGVRIGHFHQGDGSTFQAGGRR